MGWVGWGGGGSYMAWREGSLAIAGMSKSASAGTSLNVNDEICLVGDGCFFFCCCCCCCCCLAASSFNCLSLGGMRMTNTPGLLSPDVSKADGNGPALSRAAMICFAMAVESGGALAEDCADRMPSIAEDTVASLLLLLRGV